MIVTKLNNTVMIVTLLKYCYDSNQIKRHCYSVKKYCALIVAKLNNIVF